LCALAAPKGAVSLFRHAIEELIAGDDDASVLQQVGGQIEFARSQLDPLAADRDLACSAIDDDVAAVVLLPVVGRFLAQLLAPLGWWRVWDPSSGQPAAR
jgi:hypothetical protein